jgi:putative phosphoribosyl transferase
MIRTPFANRREAGEALAGEVRRLDLADPVILALPRGGVPVAFEVARAIGAPLDILLVRKIGAPGHEEYGIGALVDGASPQLVLDEAAARTVGASRAYIDRQVALQLREIERRRAAYRTGPPIALGGRTVVLVDDGIATGGTVRAALQALAKTGCRRIVLAVPVAPRDVVSALQELCDEIVCIYSPDPFYAVGAQYCDFTQTEDEEVVRLLADARRHLQVDHG